MNAYTRTKRRLIPMKRVAIVPREIKDFRRQTERKRRLNIGVRWMGDLGGLIDGVVGLRLLIFFLIWPIIQDLDLIYNNEIRAVFELYHFYQFLYKSFIIFQKHFFSLSRKMKLYLQFDNYFCDCFQLINFALLLLPKNKFCPH